MRHRGEASGQRGCRAGRGAAVTQVALCGLLSLVPLSCERRDKPSDPQRSGPASALSPGRRPAQRPATPGATPTAATASARPAPSASDLPPPVPPDGGAAARGDEIYLGQARAVGLGSAVAVALTDSEQLAVALLDDGDPPPLEQSGEQVPFFAPALVGQGPARAYWVSRGRLVRRKIASDGTVAELEVLARGAAPGTGVSAGQTASEPDRDVVLYISGDANAQGERSPRLWIQGQGDRALSQTAGGATSVAVVERGAGRYLLLTLDGRNAMSSVHAFDLQLGADGKAKVGADRVVYVAGGVQWYTAMAGVGTAAAPVAFLPVAKDITRFGLVSLRIDPGEQQAREWWIDYPNGIDPAPVAAARICGRPMVAFVRPETKEAGAAQVVRLGQIDDEARVAGLHTVASAQIITYVALAAAARSAGAKPSPGRTKTGGWIAYATDAGLWARALGCE